MTEQAVIQKGTAGYVDGIAVRLVIDLNPTDQYAWVETVSDEYIKINEAGSWYSHSASGFVIDAERFVVASE